jgi:uncharacterized protein YdaU (DUF1376 family)
MAALPYLQLYVADYLSDTMHLSTEEHGAYILLIMNYWQTGKPINSKHIKAITKLSNERITDVIETLQHFFNVDVDGLWFHKRIEADLEKVRDKSIKSSNAGKISAELRWKNNTKVTNVITDVIETLQRNCNHTETETKTDTKTDKIKDICAKAQPKKISSQTLLAEWGINENLSNDFIVHRKLKKAAITETALKGFQREADKAKISLSEAITYSIERGWVTFKNDWYQNAIQQTQAANKETKHDYQLRHIRNLTTDPEDMPRYERVIDITGYNSDQMDNPPF